jgi:hypothetical protein
MKRFLGYVLAFVVGVLPAFFIVFNAVFPDSNGIIFERMVSFVITIVAYGLLGAIFGLIAAGPSWKWGIALSLPAVFLILFYTAREPGNAGLHLLYLVIAVGSACLGAYLAARLKKAAVWRKT